MRCVMDIDVAVTVKAEEARFRVTADLAKRLIDHVEALEQAVAVR